MMSALAISIVKGTADRLVSVQIDPMSFQITVVGQMLEAEALASRTMNC